MGNGQLATQALGEQGSARRLGVRAVAESISIQKNAKKVECQVLTWHTSEADVVANADLAYWFSPIGARQPRDARRVDQLFLELQVDAVS